MYLNEEIKALISLLDDSDLEVYESVKGRLLELKVDLSELLVEYKALNYNPLIVERLEEIQMLSQSNLIAQDLVNWANDSEQPKLLDALLIINNWLSNDVEEAFLRKQVEQVKQNIWLEMSQYLTILEQLHVLNSILFNFYNFHTEDAGIDIPDSQSFFLDKILSSHVGNRYSMACLYIYLAHEFNIPINAVYLQNNELYLAIYHDSTLSYNSNILGFMHPSFGNVHTYEEMLLLLRNETNTIDYNYFEPLSNQALITLFIEQLQIAFLVEKQFTKSKALEEIKSVLSTYLPKHLQ